MVGCNDWNGGGMGRGRIILSTVSLSPPVAIAQEIFRRDKAFRRELEPGRGLMEDNVFSKYLLCSFSSRSFVLSPKCSADFLEGCLDEQFAAHPDAAMKEGIRNLKAFVAQRESPGQHMLIVAIQ